MSGNFFTFLVVVVVVIGLSSFSLLSSLQESSFFSPNH